MSGERTPSAYRICSRQKWSWTESGDQGGGGTEPVPVADMVAFLR
jgi:hypothetical protein